LQFENYCVNDMRAFSSAEKVCGIKQDAGVWYTYAKDPSKCHM